jgi:hypothetical protein
MQVERMIENGKTSDSLELQEIEKAGKEGKKMKFDTSVLFCCDSPFYGRSLRQSNVLVAVLASVQEELPYIVQERSACDRSVSQSLRCDPGVPCLQSASRVSTHHFSIRVTAFVALLPERRTSSVTPATRF